MQNDYSRRIMSLIVALALVLGGGFVPVMAAEQAPSLVHHVTITPRVVEGTADTYEVTVSAEPQNGSISESGEIGDVDVIFLMDISYSMDGEKMDAAKSGATSFVNQLITGPDSTVRVGVATYGSEGEIVHNLSGDADSLKMAIDGIKAKGVTNLGQGLSKAEEMFDAHGRDGGNKVLVILGDGMVTDDKAVSKDSVDALLQKYPGMTIKTIGYGVSGSTATFFKELAAKDTLNGKYYDAKTDNLTGVFDDIAKDVITPITLSDLTIQCPKTPNFNIVAGSLTAPEALTFDMDAFSAGIIKAEATAPRGGEALSFTYRIQIDPVAAASQQTAEFNTLNYQYTWQYGSEGNKKTESVEEQVIAPVFYINTKAGDGGSITDSLIVGRGANGPVEWKAQEGYQLKTALLDGTTPLEGTAHTFTDVDTDHQVEATFEKSVAVSTTEVSKEEPTTSKTPATGLYNGGTPILMVSGTLVLLGIMILIRVGAKHKA